jgi:hypothetical protein
MTSYKARIYLSMVDPEDTGQRTVGVPADQALDPGHDLQVTYILPIEARDRLTEACPHCGNSHEVLWVIKRRPAGIFGHFPVFNINGGKVVVDASLPTGVTRLPKDAKRLSPEQAAALWHSSGELHEFGAGVED